MIENLADILCDPETAAAFVDGSLALLAFNAVLATETVVRHSRHMQERLLRTAAFAHRR